MREVDLEPSLVRKETLLNPKENIKKQHNFLKYC